MNAYQSAGDALDRSSWRCAGPQQLAMHWTAAVVAELGLPTRPLKSSVCSTLSHFVRVICTTQSYAGIPTFPEREKDPQPYLIEETLLVKECAQRIVWHHRQALWNSVELLSCACTSTMYVFSVPVVYNILLGNKEALTLLLAAGILLCAFLTYNSKIDRWQLHRDMYQRIESNLWKFSIGSDAYRDIYHSNRSSSSRFATLEKKLTALAQKAAKKDIPPPTQIDHSGWSVMNSAWQIVTNLCENSGIYAPQSAQDDNVRNASFVSVSDQRRYTTIKRHDRRFVHDLCWCLLSALLSCPAPQLQCCDSALDADSYVTLRLRPMLVALEGRLRVRALLRYATVALLMIVGPVLLLGSTAAINSARLWMILSVTVLLSAAAWYVCSWSKLEGPTRVTVRVLHRHINWWWRLSAREKLRVTAVDELVHIGEDIVLKGGCGSTEAQHLRSLVMSEDEEVMWLEYFWCKPRTD